MASYVTSTSPRKTTSTRGDVSGLSKTVHAIPYASDARHRGSYTLPSSNMPVSSSSNSISLNSGGSYVTKEEVVARRSSKNQYGISQSMHGSSSSSLHVSSSSGMIVPSTASYSSIDYDPYKKYKNPAANGGANAQFSPASRSCGYNIPTSVGHMSRTESFPENSQPFDRSPNTGVDRKSISNKSAISIDGGPTSGLISEGDPVRCDKIDYEIKGQAMQMVEIELDPDETCIAEAGNMMFMDDFIFFDTKLGCGSEVKKGFFKRLTAAGGRVLAGESLFLTHFSNKGNGKSRVAFGAPYPGTIIPVNLATLPKGKITCQRDSFLCAAYGTKVTCSFNKRIGSGFFGGEGFVLQKLEGDGMAFIHASGQVIKRELNRERLRLDPGCLLAYSSGIDFEIDNAKGLKSAFFASDSIHLAILQGTGTVWMQSLPFSRVADRIARNSGHYGPNELG